MDGGTNELVIEDGEARLTEADCPDSLCVNMGRISRSGQSIICLPHQVVVRIVDDSAAETQGVDDVDIVTGGRQ